MTSRSRHCATCRHRSRVSPTRRWRPSPTNSAVSRRTWVRSASLSKASGRMRIARAACSATTRPPEYSAPISDSCMGPTPSPHLRTTTTSRRAPSTSACPRGAATTSNRPLARRSKQRTRRRRGWSRWLETHARSKSSNGCCRAWPTRPTSSTTTCSSKTRRAQHSCWRN